MKKTRRILAVVLPLVAVALVGWGLYYLTLPAMNPESKGFWWYLVLIGLLLGIPCYFRVGMEYSENDRVSPETKMLTSIAVATMVIPFLCLLVGGIYSMKIWHAEKHVQLLESKIVDMGIEEYAPEINTVPMMDTVSDGLLQDTASYLANRELGTLVDTVSQFDLAGGTEIILNGRAVKVFPLEYEGYFKWKRNRDDGIKKYVVVDLATKEVAIKEFKEGLQYVPSAFWDKDLKRHIRGEFPSEILGEIFFELDENNQPYYIVQVIEHKVGMFGAKDVTGVIVVDPVTGDMEKYSLQDVPTWVDNVVDPELVRNQFNNYSSLRHGWKNSIWGQLDVTQVTPHFSKERGKEKYSNYKGYSYIPYNGELYAYTGETSVSSDESNIGFLLINLRTKEIQRFLLPSAEEYSAIDATEGVVQHLGYTATFPMLVKVEGIPTYVMPLRDQGGLVKKYGFVAVQDLQNVVVEDTFEDAVKAYCQTMDCPAPTTDIAEEAVISGRISDIRSGEKSGTTYFYLQVDGQYYRLSLEENEDIILYNVGDSIELSCQGAEGKIIPANLN